MAGNSGGADDDVPISTLVNNLIEGIEASAKANARKGDEFKRDSENEVPPYAPEVGVPVETDLEQIGAETLIDPDNVGTNLGVIEPEGLVDAIITESINVEDGVKSTNVEASEESVNVGAGVEITNEEASAENEEMSKLETSYLEMNRPSQEVYDEIQPQAPSPEVHVSHVQNVSTHPNPSEARAPSFDLSPFLEGNPNDRIPIWNRTDQRKLAGSVAPFRRTLAKYLATHKDCEPYTNQDDIYKHTRKKPADYETRNHKDFGPLQVSRVNTVSLYNTATGKKTVGKAAPLWKNLAKHLKKNPEWIPYRGQDRSAANAGSPTAARAGRRRRQEASVNEPEMSPRHESIPQTTNVQSESISRDEKMDENPSPSTGEQATEHGDSSKEGDSGSGK